MVPWLPASEAVVSLAHCWFVSKEGPQDVLWEYEGPYKCGHHDQGGLIYVFIVFIFYVIDGILVVTPWQGAICILFWLLLSLFSQSLSYMSLWYPRNRLFAEYGRGWIWNPFNRGGTNPQRRFHGISPWANEEKEQQIPPTPVETKFNTLKSASTSTTLLHRV